MLCPRRFGRPVAASKLQLGRPKVYRSPGPAAEGEGGDGGARALVLPRPGGLSGGGPSSPGGGGSTGLVARRPGGGMLLQQQHLQPLIPDTSYYESRAEAVRRAA